MFCLFKKKISTHVLHHPTHAATCPARGAKFTHPTHLCLGYIKKFPGGGAFGSGQHATRHEGRRREGRGERIRVVGGSRRGENESNYATCMGAPQRWGNQRGSTHVPFRYGQRRKNGKWEMGGVAGLLGGGEANKESHTSKTDHSPSLCLAPFGSSLTLRGGEKVYIGFPDVRTLRVFWPSRPRKGTRPETSRLFLCATPMPPYSPPPTTITTTPQRRGSTSRSSRPPRSCPGLGCPARACGAGGLAKEHGR